MKLISFDVGLRNLAYCVLEGTNRTNVRILDWNIIDILGEQSGLDNPRCHKCMTSATWKHATEGTLACTKHKPKKTKKLTKTEINKQTSEQLQQEIERLGLTCPNKRKTDMVTLLYLHHRQNTWLRCVKSAFSGSVIDLAPAIVQSLDRRSSIWSGATKVCFENQPDRRMFAVQGMLHMYFCCRGFVCEGVSATHKLNNMVTIDDRVDSYKGRKKTGIVHAQELVPRDWVAHMMKHPKKDDLADSFLQGLWVMEHTK